MSLRTVLFRLMVPGGLVCVLAACVWFWQPRPAFFSASLPFYPYFVALLGTFLCWRFRRSRLLLILLLLAMGYSLPYVIPDAQWLSVARTVWTLLFPLNVVWLALLSERQLFSWAMLGRLLFIIVQPVVVVVLYQAEPDIFLQLLHFTPPLWPCSWTGAVLPLSWLVATCVFIVLLLLTFFRSTVEHASLVWLVTAVFAAEFVSSELSSYLFSTAALLLIIGLLEASYAMAFRDELTGLESRRAMSDYLHRLRSGYILAIVDIDHFKKVNDTHGHDVGDQVLKMVAGCLARVSGGGRAFRYGGEEFVLVFAGADKDEVLDCLNCLREQVGNSSFALRGAPRPARKPKRVVPAAKSQRSIRVTVSIGVAEWQRGLDSQQVIKRADLALYRAKKGGRNRVIG
ncbi:MAG: GGDEF domain-containing protein [Desulfuromonas sp.]|nr:GGDEF domain-containing protein [Desulfuromonas sp.]